MAVIDQATGKPVEVKKNPPGIPPKDRPEIPDSEFVVTAVAEESRAGYRRRREDRDAKQQNVDELCQEMYRDWVEANRPLNWVDVPIRVWTVSLGLEETAIFMIRKACRLLGRKPWFGHMAERVDSSGKKVFDIPFAITSDRAKVRKPSNDDDE